MSLSSMSSEGHISKKGTATQDCTYNVVDDIGEGPGHGNTQERQAQENIMYDRHNQHVCDPHPSTVEISRIGIRVG